jgi:hypothetical protein
MAQVEAQVPSSLEGMLQYAQSTPPTPIDINSVVPSPQPVETASGSDITDYGENTGELVETSEAPVQGEVLTEEAIQQSPTLQKLGALEGDSIVDNKLVRNVSTKPRGEVLTQSDILGSETLKNLGAEPGDMIDEGKLIKSGTNAPLRNFSYAYKEASGITENFANYLESKVPLGRITFDFEDGVQYISPEDAYGAGILSDDVNERRKSILEARAKDLQEDLKSFEPSDTASAMLGTIAGSIDVADIAVPAKNLLASGAVLGGLYTGSEELARTGEATVGTTAKGAALGLAGGAAVKYGGQTLKKAYDRVSKPSRTKSAETFLNKVEENVNTKIIQGSNTKNAWEQTLKELKTSNAAVSNASSLANRKIQIATTQQRAAEILDNQITHDSAVSRLVSKPVDDWLTLISTNIKEISVPIFGRMRNFEADVHVNTASKLKEVTDFTKVLVDAPKSISKDLNRHLLNGKYDEAKALINTFAPNKVALVDDLRKTLDNTYDELVSAGREGLNKLPNFFPRIVKDYQGLRRALGVNKTTQIDEALKAVAKAKGHKNVGKLSIEDKSDVIDKITRGYKISYVGDRLQIISPSTKTVGTGGKIGAKRQIDEVTTDMQEFYYSPAESLQMYLRNAVNDVETRKFFGNAKRNTEVGSLDRESSIGSYIAKAREEGLLRAKDEEKLLRLLDARFVGGEQSMSKSGQLLRDTGYLGTIADVASAIIQVADVATPMRKFGIKNTVKAMFSPSQREIKAVDLGIERTLNEEITNPTKLANFLVKMFKASQFQRVDRLGKEVTINAALKKYQNLAQTTAGRAKIRKEYGEVFGNEVEGIIADLQARQITPSVKQIAFHWISDIQPVSKLEHPMLYNKAPEARLMYMLKSFTLKQWDLVRNDVIREWKHGSKKEAVKQATLLSAYLTAANVGVQAAKDIMLGRDVDIEEIPDRAIWALLGVFGANRYMSERYIERGDITGAVINLLTPPTVLIDAPVAAIKDTIDDNDNAKSYLRSIPIVGQILYAWFGGGAEAYNERNR